MQTIFLLFMRLPWWGFLILAIGVVWLGETVSQRSTAHKATVEAALTAPAPLLQPLTRDIAYDAGALNEVTLRVQVDVSQNTRLTQNTNGIVQSEHRMMALLPPGATSTPASFRTFIVVPEAQGPALVSWIADNTVDWGPVGPIIKVGGVLDSHSTTRSHIRDVLDERGLGLADNPLFLDSFIDGRQAGLQALAANSGPSDAMIIRIFAAIVALIGIVKRVVAVVFGGSADAKREALFASVDPANQPDTTDADLPAALPAQAPPMSAMAGSPLARIAERDAARRADTAAAPKPPSLAARLMGGVEAKAEEAVQRSAPDVAPDNAHRPESTRRPAASLTAAATQTSPIQSAPTVAARIGGLFAGKSGSGKRRSGDPFERLAREQSAQR